MRTSGAALTPAAARHRLLEIALRRARPGTGSAALFLERRTAMATWPDLTHVLTGVPWAVAGAVAARAYMPERATRDLDVLVPAERAPEVRARLRAAGYAEVQELSIGVLVDVIESSLPWVTEALRWPACDPPGLPVLALPYLVLPKLHAARLQDLADAGRMLGLASPAVRQETREVFQRWLTDALDDLESLVTLGEPEMGG